MRVLHLNGPALPLRDPVSGTCVPDHDIVAAFSAASLPQFDAMVCVRPFLMPDPTLDHWLTLQRVLDECISSWDNQQLFFLLSWPEESEPLKQFVRGALEFFPKARVQVVPVLRSITGISELRKAHVLLDRLPVVLAPGMEETLSSRPPGVTCPVLRYAMSHAHKGAAVERFSPGNPMYCVTDAKDSALFERSPELEVTGESLTDVSMAQFVEALQRGEGDTLRPTMPAVHLDVDQGAILNRAVIAAGGTQALADAATLAFDKGCMHGLVPQETLDGN